MWLGPPYMKRKMTLLALAVKCGFLGAMGFVNWLLPSAATACRPRKPSCDSIDVRASDPKPQPVSHRNSRRVRRQNWREDGPTEANSLMILSVSFDSNLAVRRGGLPRQPFAFLCLCVMPVY